MLLVRDAAAGDPELADLLALIDRQRLKRMRHNARALATRGFLRRGMSVNHAADIMWMAVAPELYDLLVVRRGWTAAQFGEHVTNTILTVVRSERAH